jgi:polar amino acid transport system substrate-binding protein
MPVLSKTIAAGVFAASLSLSGAALAQSFDLTPEQAARPHTTKSDKAAALISPDYKFATPGELTVAITLGTPPLGTYATDSATPVGGDPDIASLLAEKLGLKLNLVPTAWPDWPLGVISGKFDAVISNVTVTEERKEKLDFSTYRKDVLGFYVKADSPITSIKEPKDAAGLKIITGSGTNQEKILLAWDKQNTANGLKPIEFQYYDDGAAAQLAIASGRADAEFDPNSSLAYWAATDHKTKLVGIVSGGWPLTADIAVTTRKGAGLADAFTQAINEIIADGTYAQALKRWSLDAEAVDKSETNPPGLPKS